MTPSEATVILSAAAAVDNRIITEVTAREWADALKGLELDECLEALRLFRRTATIEYLMPGHIRERVRIARDYAAMRLVATRGIEKPIPPAGQARAYTERIKAELAAKRAAEAKDEAS